MVWYNVKDAHPLFSVVDSKEYYVCDGFWNNETGKEVALWEHPSFAKYTYSEGFVPYTMRDTANPAWVAIVQCGLLDFDGKLVQVIDLTDVVVQRAFAEKIGWLH